MSEDTMNVYRGTHSHFLGSMSLCMGVTNCCLFFGFIFFSGREAIAPTLRACDLMIDGLMV